MPGTIGAPPAAAEVAEERELGKAVGVPGFAAVPVEWLRAAITDEADRAWVLARARPHPLATFSQPLRLTNPAAAQIPRAYIFCTEDKGTAEDDHTVRNAGRYRSDPVWRYRDIPSDHFAPVKAPRETSEALLSLI